MSSRRKSEKLNRKIKGKNILKRIMSQKGWILQKKRISKN